MAVCCLRPFKLSSPGNHDILMLTDSKLAREKRLHVGGLGVFLMKAKMRNVLTEAEGLAE